MELATTLKNLGAKWLSEKLMNFTPCCKSDLSALSSEFHPTSSTTKSPQKKEQWEKSEQKTKIMEKAKLEGEKEILKNCI